jgi:hypothetical protein
VLYLQLPLTVIHVHHVVVVWYLDLQLPVPITTNVVSWNPAHGEVYWIQLYVIKFGNDLPRQTSYFIELKRSIYKTYLLCYKLKEYHFVMAALLAK